MGPQVGVTGLGTSPCDPEGGLAFGRTPGDRPRPGLQANSNGLVTSTFVGSPVNDRF